MRVVCDARGPATPRVYTRCASELSAADALAPARRARARRPHARTHHVQCTHQGRCTPHAQSAPRAHPRVYTRFCPLMRARALTRRQTGDAIRVACDARGPATPCVCTRFASELSAADAFAPARRARARHACTHTSRAVHALRAMHATRAKRAARPPTRVHTLLPADARTRAHAATDGRRDTRHVLRTRAGGATRVNTLRV